MNPDRGTHDQGQNGDVGGLDPQQREAYIPLEMHTPLQCAPASVICFYLPQFHTIPENDLWWGTGFTEWVNVKRAQAQFPGHRQPRLPGELGYYDLRNPLVRRRQVQLALNYGIGGFCFYFYWFNGKRLLEEPIREYAHDPEARLPFCLCWANENWTRRWDGLEHEVLIGQNHSPEDDLAFIEHVASYMRNPRYIRVDGRPLLVIYRPNLLPSVEQTANRWREWCRQNGLGEIALACTQSFEAADPARYGLDFAIEFPPNNTSPPDITVQTAGPDAAFRGHVFDWAALAERSRDYSQTDYPLFRAVAPGWDNTPRRGDSAIVFVNNTPERFQAWLENAIDDTRSRFAQPEERLIFINAWNEWGEGAYLEPDMHYGYAWLSAVRKALESRCPPSNAIAFDSTTASSGRDAAGRIALQASQALAMQVENLKAEMMTLRDAVAGQASSATAAAHDNKQLRHTVADLESKLAEQASLNLQLIDELSLSETELDRVLEETKLLAANVAHAHDAITALEAALGDAEVRAAIREDALNQANTRNEARLAALEKQAAKGSPLARIARLWDTFRRSPHPVTWRRLRCTLLPVNQLTSIEPGRYLSSGDDPHFMMRFPHEKPPLGWCRIRLVMRSEDGGPLNPSIYIDDGGGFREGMRRDLPVSGIDGVTELWLRLSDGTLALRLDPVDRHCTFRIVALELVQAGRFARAAALVMPYIKRALRHPATGRRLAITACRLLQSGGIKAIKERILKNADRQIDYAHWIARFDQFTQAELARLQSIADRWRTPPLISILMPVYNTPPRLLQEAIASVRRQTYAKWELCIADDASTTSGISEILERAAEADARIRVVSRTENGHISAAANSALDLATGEFIALLDHDDLLPPHALHFVAEALVRHPGAGILYSDEDKIDEHGRRYDPYFKSEWDPYLMRSHNMLCHLTVVRTQLARRVGGFRAGYEGAQDYDLVLRCAETIQPENIVHIPRILYHWRAIAGSTATAGAEKPYAVIAGRRAVQDHVDRSGIDARVQILPFGHYRVKYALPPTKPLVSVIIPTRNMLPLLRQCIESIRTKTSYANYEIVVVDNNSDDALTIAYLATLRTLADVTVIPNPGPFNFSAINNDAASRARGEVLCLLNNDIEVISPDWLCEMVSLAMQPGAGAVGARLLYPDGRLQHGGVILGIGGVAGHAHKYLPRDQYGYMSRAVLTQSLSAVTAACLVVRKSAYLEVGGLDEVNLPIAFNDVDFCLRLEAAGYRNIWTPFAELFHHESASRGSEDSPKKQQRFQREAEYMLKRWGAALQQDPAYNPNLTLVREDFSLAWPPRNRPIQ